MSKKFKKLLQSVKSTYHYVSAKISLDFAKDVNALMVAQKLSKKELAEKIETSPAYVTKLLRGDANYTVETMAKVAMALDADVNVSLVSKSEGRWHSRNASKGEVIYYQAGFNPYNGTVANDEHYRAPAAA